MLGNSSLGRRTMLCFFLAVLFSFMGDIHAEDPPIIRFAVMSDIHIHKNNTDTQRRFINALEDYWELQPQLDFIAINGDLTNGFPSHYKVLRQLLEQTSHPPLYFTPGNHEFNKILYNEDGKLDFKHLPNGWSSEQAMALFKQFTGNDKPYHDAWVKGFHFIFLADEKSRDVDPAIDKHGYISKQQFSWLEEKLQERKPGTEKPTFVFFHQPLPDTVPGSQDGVNIIQHRELRRILNRHPEIIFFSGHTHYSLRKTDQKHFETFLMLGSSSIMRHEESLYIEVYDHHIEIYSRDHRLTEWIPGKSYRYEMPGNMLKINQQRVPMSEQTDQLGDG